MKHIEKKTHKLSTWRWRKTTTKIHETNMQTQLNWYNRRPNLKRKKTLQKRKQKANNKKLNFDRQFFFFVLLFSFVVVVQQYEAQHQQVDTVFNREKNKRKKNLWTIKMIGPTKKYQKWWLCVMAMAGHWPFNVLAKKKDFYFLWIYLLLHGCYMEYLLVNFSYQIKVIYV